MKKSRDPFSLETAEGFPVVESGPATGAHLRRPSPDVKLSDHPKNEENLRKKENRSVNLK